MTQQNDFIGVWDNALPAELCDKMVSMFEAFPEIQKPGEVGSGVDQKKKHSVDCCISEYKEWQEINQVVFNTTIQHLIQYIRQYPHLVCGALAPTLQMSDGTVAELSADNVDQVPDEQMMQVVFSLYRPGHLNMQKYLKGEGGFHHWHSEIYPREANCETLHRVLLFMFFLNDVDEGGQTKFLYQQREVQPKKGRIVIAPAGFTHTHKGSVPVSDDKYIVTSWILFQRAEQMYGGS